MSLFARHLPACKFILPTAALRPVTRFGGQPTTAWFDLVGAKERKDEPCEGIEEAETRLHALIAAEVSAGLPTERIFLGGFSQGAGLSFFTGARYPGILGGLIILSGYLPLTDTVRIIQPKTPILACHGTADGMVLPQWGAQARAKAESAGMEVTYHEYPGLDHEVTQEELETVIRWIQQRLRETEAT